MNNALIELKHVYVNLQEQSILDDITLTIYSNQIITIIGPNGAGKTTLLKTLLGLIKPTAGKIHKQPKLSVGYVPQKLQINPNLPISVHRFIKLVPNLTDNQIEQAMNDVGAFHVLQRSMHALSGGELQRVLLARALLRNPQLLALDEPTQGVDINGQVELYHLINQIKNRYYCGVVMVSHDLNLVMANTDSIICLNQHICCSGHPEQVSNDPAFINLFGEYVNNFAIYHHQHDHSHSPYKAVENHTCKKDCNHA